MVDHSERSCVLGLDIGTTSTIGVLINPPDQTLALASRPVALRSDHVGWAEEDPEQWWANVGEIVRELMRTSGASPRRMWPRSVWPECCRRSCCSIPSGRLLRPSIQQSDARCGAEVDDTQGRDRREDLPRQGGQRRQPAARRREAQVDRASRTRGLRRHRHRVRLLRLHQLASHRRTGDEQNWALEAGFVDLRSHAVDDALVALAHIPRAALPRKVASHQFWASSGVGRSRRKRACARNAGHGRDRPRTISRPRSGRASSGPAMYCSNSAARSISFNRDRPRRRASTGSVRALLSVPGN